MDPSGPLRAGPPGSAPLHQGLHPVCKIRSQCDPAGILRAGPPGSAPLHQGLHPVCGRNTIWKRRTSMTDLKGGLCLCGPRLFYPTWPARGRPARENPDGWLIPAQWDPSGILRAGPPGSAPLHQGLHPVCGRNTIWKRRTSMTDFKGGLCLCGPRLVNPTWPANRIQPRVERREGPCAQWTRVAEPELGVARPAKILTDG